MLMNDEQVAINDLTVAYHESAEWYVDAADTLQDESLAGLFKRLGAERDDTVGRLSGIIRQLGGLPRGADTDKEGLNILLTHAKAVLSNEERQTFLQEGIASDSRIVSLIDDALALEFADDIMAYLKHIRSRELVTIETLRRAASTN